MHCTIFIYILAFSPGFLCILMASKFNQKAGKYGCLWVGNLCARAWKEGNFAYHSIL
jgi:hypothetical protein